MAKNIEIEIQVQIENVNELLEFLNKEAKFVGEKKQLDRYFCPAHRNFISIRPVSEWLRLRDSSGKYSITYKNWHYDANGRSYYCDEYETQFENIEQMESIFKSLDMKYVVTVDKVRRIWLFEDYEVAIDFIHGLGNFVEIEYKGQSTRLTPATITQDMITFLKRFHPGKITRNYVGYPFQILFPNEVKTESF